jgi:hypothetical protein
MANHGEKAHIKQHLDETLGQQRLLDGCIRRLDGTPSGFKDAVGKTKKRREVQAMATWMLQHMSELTDQLLLRNSAGLGAKG